MPGSLNSCRNLVVPLMVGLLLVLSLIAIQLRGAFETPATISTLILPSPAKERARGRWVQSDSYFRRNPMIAGFTSPGRSK
jgi:hypothetical protein